MRSDWKGIMKVLEVQHIRDGKVIWEDKNLYNILHTKGEQFFLEALFANDGDVLPNAYYLGLDAREEIDVADTIENLTGEPITNGYLRQQLSVAAGWNVILVSGVYRAMGNILTFQASGGSWGPVTNLFLTTAADETGVLIASVALTQEVSLDDGDIINMRMSLSLRDFSS